MTKRMLIVVFLTLTITQPADIFGSDAVIDELGQCAKITDPMERLRCYDLLQKKSETPAASISVTKGKWQVRSDISAIDDSRNVVISLVAEKSISGWLEEATPELMLRCKENTTEVYIITGMSADVEYGTDLHTVTIRFDKEKATKYRFSASTDNKALFAQDPINFIRTLLKHETMLFQFTPFNASPTMTTFDLTGLASVIKELQTACHWK